MVQECDLRAGPLVPTRYIAQLELAGAGYQHPFGRQFDLGGKQVVPRIVLVLVGNAGHEQQAVIGQPGAFRLLPREGVVVEPVEVFEKHDEVPLRPARGLRVLRNGALACRIRGARSNHTVEALPRRAETIRTVGQWRELCERPLDKLPRRMGRPAQLSVLE